MPYTLKPSKIHVKDPNSTGYLPQNVITEESTQEQLTQIQTAGATQVNAINTQGSAKVSEIQTKGAAQVSAIESKGAQTLDSIPSDYTTLQGDVSDLKSAFKPYITDYPIVNPYGTVTVGQDEQTTEAGKRILIDGTVGDSSAYTLWTINMSDKYVYELNAHPGGDCKLIRFIQLEDNDGNVIAWIKASESKQYTKYISGFNGVCKVSHRNYYVRGIKKYNTITSNNEIEIPKRKYNAVAYIANNGEATWSKHGNTSINFTLSDNVILRVGNQDITINLSDIISAVDGTNVTYSNGVFTGQHYCLYYDLEDGLPHFCSSMAMSEFTKYPILFYAHYGSVRSGLLVDYMSVKQTEEMYRTSTYRAYTSVAYVANSGYASWSNHGNTTVRLFISDDIVIRADGILKTIALTDIVSAADEAQNVTYSGGAFTGSQFCLYYDVTTRTPKFTSTSDVDTICKNIILFLGHYGAIRYGLLVDWMNTKRVEALTSEVPTVPDYYKDHIQTSINKIRENMMEVGKSGETFIWITDIHWESNTQNSPQLVRAIMKALPINLLLCGGDIINQGNRDTMLKLMSRAIKAFSPTENIVMPSVFGNHDNNWNDYGDQHQHPEWKFDLNDQYALMQKQAENLITYISSDKWNFYFDVKNTKTRFIGLDTGDDGTFGNYGDLATCLLDTPSGYHVVLMAHWLYNNGAKSTACINLENMIDAYNAKGSTTIDGTSYNFANAAATVSLFIAGHMHKDMSWATPNGVPIILTDCDAGRRTYNTDYPFVEGTITEQAFDVVTVNYDTGVVKTVRIGRGVDREFTRGT